jgi:hypothetical protein
VTRRSLDDIPDPPVRVNGADQEVDYSEYANRRPTPGKLTNLKWTWDQNQYAERFRTRIRNTHSNAADAYESYFPAMVFRLRLLGATNKMIAEACNTTETTIWEWTKGKHAKPEFKDAMEMGGDMADAMIAHSVFHSAMGYTHDDEKIMVVDKQVVREPFIKHYPPDTAAGTFWLVNRQKELWKHRNSTELTGEDGRPLVPPQLIINPVSADAPKAAPRRRVAAQKKDELIKPEAEVVKPADPNPPEA